MPACPLLQGKVFRIGHLGNMDELMLSSALAGVEMCLIDNGVKVGLFIRKGSAGSVSPLGSGGGMREPRPPRRPAPPKGVARAVPSKDALLLVALSPASLPSRRSPPARALARRSGTGRRRARSSLRASRS